jgi:threonine/homoserine/homoserine lactone efflux protein
MMFESWAAFTAASAVLLIIPGPTVLLVVSYALGQGWRTALPMAVGVALGDFTAMTLSMLGLGALLAASATLFTILKWVGAGYLVWLGIKLWRAGGALEASPRTDAVSAIKMLGHAWLVTALNPKSITFFVAFLPAFLDPHADFLRQMLVFETTFLVLAFAQRLRLRPGRLAGAWLRFQPAGDRRRQQGGRRAADRRRRRDRDVRRIAELNGVYSRRLRDAHAGAIKSYGHGWKPIRWSSRPATSAAASVRRCCSGSRRVRAAKAS